MRNPYWDIAQLQLILILVYYYGSTGSIFTELVLNPMLEHFSLSYAHMIPYHAVEKVQGTTRRHHALPSKPESGP